MIHYIATAPHRYTMASYLRTWGAPLAHKVRVLSYFELAHQDRLQPGAYIFSDLDRLPPVRLQAVRRIFRRLAGSPRRFRPLNDPRAPARRLDLLNLLHARGVNPYKAVPADGPLDALTYPVFLRAADGHGGALTEPLPDRASLQRAIESARAGGMPPGRLLAVEYVHTADRAGMVRKYSAFYVDGQVIPRHVIFSRHWMLKFPTLIDPGLVDEELRYLGTNPHREWIASVFRLARIDYGRIDYALAQGRPVVWEINTNPTVMLQPQRYDPLHLPAQRWFAARIADALGRLDATLRGHGVRNPLTPRDRALAWGRAEPAHPVRGSRCLSAPR